ncbi:response regulator [bacterium]|nr:response regulator [bacterium]
MNLSLRILIADDESRMREFLSAAITRLGHQVVGAIASGHELVLAACEHRPDLIVTDIRMPDGDGIDAAAEIYKHFPVPIILVSAFHDDELLERARHQHVLAYLVKPIKDSDLAPAIALATARFAEFETLRREADDARQALEDRKLIERAKGILMKRAGLDEPAAFRRLQKHATSRRVKLVEIARSLIDAEQTFAEEI